MLHRLGPSPVCPIITWPPKIKLAVHTTASPSQVPTGRRGGRIIAAAIDGMVPDIFTTKGDEVGDVTIQLLLNVPVVSGELLREHVNRIFMASTTWPHIRNQSILRLMVAIWTPPKVV